MRDELRRHQSLGQEEPQIKFNETPFDTVFEVGDELGSGQFAVVRKVVKKATGEEFAAKFIKKRRYATSRRGVTRANIEREVSVLRTVGGHSNVIELHEVYETPSDVILVLELVSGGELFDHVCARECLDEVEAAAFVRQILLGIKHLHSLHIVHLDIKPENVMLKRRGDSQVKLIDFGLSRLIPPGHVVKDMVGTPEFVAPEVVNYEALSPATDMWALGVVTYILLSGGSPFLGDTRDETFCNITGVNYHFTDSSQCSRNWLALTSRNLFIEDPRALRIQQQKRNNGRYDLDQGSYFKNTSACAKDFISRLFVRDVTRRATVDDCLRHPWIRGPDGDDVDLRKSSCISISHIHSFKQRQRWRVSQLEQRAVELVLVCNRVTRSVRLAISQATKMKRTIETRYDPNDMVTSSVLIAAEMGGVRELSELSMVRGFPNLSNKQKETAAHVAAGAGHIEALSFLNMKGAQLSAEDQRGFFNSEIFNSTHLPQKKKLRLTGNLMC
ncbi:kinase domain protein [Necator americanus]|uniref:Kinase domain protein n=1 Tax=Necator americanus TaxID=51031 RepID=W2TTW3_NECAM|nr:kinase domain protein [Necator americanus]ETN85520.1 kinase domain protein [Necator americanus]